MKKTSLAVSLAVLSLSVSSVASAAEPEAAPASPHAFTGNVALVSNYVFAVLLRRPVTRRFKAASTTRTRAVFMPAPGRQT